MEDKPPLTEQQLQALLCLKRYEQPAPGYFDELLKNVHRRQREEMLRRPAWRLAVERLRALWASLQMDWRYAGTMAGVVLVGVGAIRLSIPARNDVPAQFATANVSRQSSPSDIAFTLATARPEFDIKKAKRPAQSTVIAGSQGPTRFVIDTQPASYETTQIRF